MSEMTETKPVSRLTPWKNRLAITAFTLVAFVAPYASAEINLSALTDVINAFIDVIDPITSLIIAIVPLWFVIMILGFIMGLLAAVLGIIKNGMRF